MYTYTHTHNVIECTLSSFSRNMQQKLLVLSNTA